MSLHVLLSISNLEVEITSMWKESAESWTSRDELSTRRNLAENLLIIL